MINKIFLRGKGEGRVHIRMGAFVRDLMEEMGYIDVRERRPEKYQNPKSDNEWIASEYGVYHEFDVHGAQILHGPDKTKYYFHTYVEIDGEWHDNKIQKNKDKTAEQMLKEYYQHHPKMGSYRLIRLKKDLVMASMKKKGNTGLLKQKLALEIPVKCT